METMKPEEPVDAKRHKRKNQSEEATMELIHIKEKKKKWRDHSVAMATDIVGEDSAVPVETHHKKKKKKKKRELENVTSETDINGEESEVAMETEHKRRKKKKEEEKVISEIYKRGEDSEVALETEHKKKKKKKKEEEENVTIETYNRGEESEVALETEHKKKKRKRREPEHVTIATDINGEESEVAVETEHKKKKKKKKTEEEEEENVTIETYNRGEDSEVAVETEHKKKKRKKREQEHVTIATDINGEESEVAVETEHKKKKKKKGEKREQEHVTIATDMNGEESEVSMETEHKKKRDDETVSIKTYNRGEDSEVTMETEHKKKKQQEEEEEEEDVNGGTDIIGESEVAVQTEPQEEENVTIATSISDEVSVKREQRQWSCESVSMAAARSKKPAEEKNHWEDPALLQELEEFVPNVRRRSADAIRKLLHYDLERFRRFKQQGVAVRWGRGSEEEDQMIIRNLQDFMALTGISSPTELVYPERYKDKCKQIRALKAQHGFMEKMAEGIPRPCLQVYLKARRMFDPLNHRGRFSEDEIKSLIKLQTRYGNDWKLISEKMGRSIFSLQKRFNNLAAGHGPWTPDETTRLKKAVRTHLEGLQSPARPGLTREQLSNGLPWKRISQEVQTRSWVQCRLKWFSVLQNRLALNTDMFGRGPECVRTKILLLKVLFDKCPTSTADVRWDQVAQAMGKMTRVSAQRMFQRLKTSKVPGWKKMSIKEVIETLHREVLPALQAQLENLQDGLQTPQNPQNPPEENPQNPQNPQNPENPPEENPPEETYQLDRIFAEE